MKSDAASAFVVRLAYVDWALTEALLKSDAARAFVVRLAYVDWALTEARGHGGPVLQFAAACVC